MNIIKKFTAIWLFRRLLPRGIYTKIPDPGPGGGIKLWYFLRKIKNFNGWVYQFLLNGRFYVGICRYFWCYLVLFLIILPLKLVFLLILCIFMLFLHIFRSYLSWYCFHNFSSSITHLINRLTGHFYLLDNKRRCVKNSNIFIFYVFFFLSVLVCSFLFWPLY